MPQDRYQSLLMARLGERDSWEQRLAKSCSLTDLDMPQFWKVIKAGIALNRLPSGLRDNSADILERLKLIIDGELTNGAMALFGNPMRHLYPQCLLQMARFRGIEMDEFMDEKRVFGHAFTLFDAGMQFLDRHLPMKGIFLPGQARRKDICNGPQKLDRGVSL